MNLLPVSNALFVTTIFVYIGAMSAFFAHAIWRRRATGVAAVGITMVGLGLHFGSLLTRAIAAGRVPWGNMYEFSLTGSFVMVTTFLVGVYVRFRSPLLGGAVIGAALVVLGVGWVLYPSSTELVPALRSRWLTFHVFLAMSGSSILGLGSLLSGVYLIKAWWERQQLVGVEGMSDRWGAEVPVGAGVPVGAVAAGASGALVAAEPVLAGPPSRRSGPGAALASPARRGGLLSWLPMSETLDLAAHRIILFAFPIWTMAIMAGAIWGEQAWGRYWGWDPKETWSFVVWVIFAGYLHARATAGWKGRRAAWMAVAGGAALVVNFYAVNLWISGLHSYSGV
jgi:cytochrome c-type biogenesis protein CcsB